MRDFLSRVYIYLFCFFISLLITRTGVSQTGPKDYRIWLKNGTFAPEPGFSSNTINSLNSQLKKSRQSTFVFLQFKEWPDEAKKATLLERGIHLLDYVPSNTWVAEISGPVSRSELDSFSVRTLLQIAPATKIAPNLISSGSSHLLQDFQLAFFSSARFDEAVLLLESAGFTVLSRELKYFNIITVRTSGDHLFRLAEFPFVQYIEAADKPAEELNFKSRNSSRINQLQSGLAGSYMLNGDSIVIGISEVTGAPQQHPDFSSRLNTGFASLSDGYHTTHVHGIIGGAGHIAELYKGYAPGASLISLNPVPFSFVQALFNDFHTVLVNHSYAAGGFCAEIPYNSQQFVVDKLAVDLPYMQHIFACGNSGETQCSGYPLGYRTVRSGYASGKGIIAVGNIYSNGTIFEASSRGPGNGGTIKPEVVAPGREILSTVPYNGYGPNTGTSMSTPAVTAGLALMNQRYRQLHNNQYPKTGLMKAILCNTAKDAGTAGPDFIYGFGQADFFRGVKAIDNQYYFTDSTGMGAVKTKNITIPAGTTQLKVLVYWQDPPPSLLTSRALVNDLDLTVTTPSGSVVQPYILDTLPANLGNPAIRGEDHLNNIEQVVINNPAAGVYTVAVKGNMVTMNSPQSYFVSYEFLKDSLQMNFPIGNEALLPGENITIRWESNGEENSGFRLEYSPDNGNSWQLIDAAVPADKRNYEWQLPAVTSTEALIRVTRNTDNRQSVSQRFYLIGSPTIQLSPDQCPGIIDLVWNAIPNAGYYEIMLLQQDNMVKVDTTSSTHYALRGLSSDSLYFVSARAVVNGKQGRRAYAVSRKPDNGNCTGVYSDNDLMVEKILVPGTGRKYTSTGLSANQQVKLRVKNNDNQPATDFTVSYSVNGGAWITEHPTLSLAPATAFTYIFSTTYDFSTPGIYTLRACIKNQYQDTYTSNDTISQTFRHLDNAPVLLSTPYLENFEQTTDTVYHHDYFGLKGNIRFDYSNSGTDGFIRFPSNELSPTSGKSLMFDKTGFFNTNSALINQTADATYNFSSLDTAANAVGLEFSYKSLLGCIPCPSANSVWIRGNDTAAWIPVTTLELSFQPDKIIRAATFDISQLLAANGQNYSASTQLRFSQYASSHKLLVDSISFIDLSNDVSLVSIDSLLQKHCGPAVLPIRIQVRNSTSTSITNLQVNYKIDNGTTITETIPFIPAHSTKTYVFTSLASFSAAGLHTVESWLNRSNDGYTGNNSKTITVRFHPLIDKFPYLENFESGDGNWYAEGKKNTWNWGTPSTPLINKAASGTKAWKTNLTGQYNNEEISYLYSPCIDFSRLQNPAISFSMSLNTDSCFSPVSYCDYMRLDYSIDDSVWSPMPPVNTYNWQLFGWTSRFYYRWHVATNRLPVTNGPVRFRYSLRTNSMINYEGVGIDDVHIYDRLYPVYDSLNTAITQTQPVINGGNSWINFTSDGKIMAAFNPKGLNTGPIRFSTRVNPVKPVQHFHGQYYLNQSYLFKTDSPLTDSVVIRLYFTDAAADSLLFAANCIACTKPSDAYRFGISVYSNPGGNELNDSIPDNINGKWLFIENKKIRFTPYDNGYYAEFITKDLGEFRFSNGGTDQQSFLPAELLSFSAAASGKNTLLNWTIKSEINIDKYIIESARGNEAYTNNQFDLAGAVLSPGPVLQNRSYSFTDTVSGKKGVLYYRLKTIDVWGNTSISKVIPVLFTQEAPWIVFPNPSDGNYTLQYQLGSNERATLDIYNTAGQKVMNTTISGNGFIQRMDIRLDQPYLSTGVYLLKVTANGWKQTIRLVKTK